VFDGDPWPGENLGCPKEAAVPSEIRELLSTGANGDQRRALKAKDGARFTLRTSPTARRAGVVRSVCRRSRLTAPTRVVQGSFQAFEKRLAFVLPGVEGAPREAVLASGYLAGTWRTFETPN